jgi:digeranylgeranylglycerophospholipid reductase
MKVAIIGAGITGLYLAWKLAEQGQNVVVFEKKDKIGKEACSGLFSERILDFIPQSRKLIQNQIDSCLICFPRRTVKINFSRRFFVMSHCELDRLTAGLAEKAGAKIVLNREIKSLPEKYDRVIGCDGANSTVRKNLGLAEPSFRLGIQGFIAEPDEAAVVETWPTKSGFLWKIPRGREVEYGIIEEPQRARKILEEFLNKKRVKLEKMNSAFVPQGLIIPRNKKITLCGDAAGLIKPWSGGGVIWGLTAADLLLKNFPDFIKYEIEAKRFFMPKIILSKAAKKMVYFMGFNFPWLLPREFKIESDFLL